MLIVWLVVGVLAFLLVQVLARGRARALRMVEEKTGQLRHQALHDALTNLPNRALIMDRAEQMLVHARRDGTEVSAMFIDLDGFKGVNDTFGHPVGDELLRVVAARISNVLRDTDTIGRLGGDEFVDVLDTTGCRVQSGLVARRQAHRVRPAGRQGMSGAACHAGGRDRRPADTADLQRRQPGLVPGWSQDRVQPARRPLRRLPPGRRVAQRHGKAWRRRRLGPRLATLTGRAKCTARTPDTHVHADYRDPFTRQAFGSLNGESWAKVMSVSRGCPRHCPRAHACVINALWSRARAGMW